MGLKNFGFIADNFVVSVREKFVRELEEKGREDYDPADLERIMTEEWDIKRYLILAYKKEDDAILRMSQALKWRKSNNIRHLKDNYFPIEFYTLGAIFPYEKDKEGLPSLFVRVKYIKRHTELDEEVKRFLRHNIWRVDEEAYGKGWVLILDFQDCGYSHLQNMDMLHYMVTTLHYYFPAGMDYALVIDFPWFLRTCWAIAQYWIPEKRRNMVRFVAKDNIMDYFEPKNLPKYFGGTCSRPYREAPPNSPSASDFGIYTLGLDRDRCAEIIEDYKPHLDESD
jgi:hypothetical protein